MKSYLLLVVGVFIFVSTAAADPQTAGGQIVTGTSEVLKGTASATEKAIDAAATGLKDVATGTAGLVSQGANTVGNELTEKPINSAASARLSGEINCKSAKTDIAILEGERASTSAQMKNGVKSVLPLTAATRILQGTYVDGVQVAAGEYNQDIDTRLAQIRSTCNVH